MSESLETASDVERINNAPVKTARQILSNFLQRQGEAPAIEQLEQSEITLLRPENPDELRGNIYSALGNAGLNVVFALHGTIDKSNRQTLNHNLAAFRSGLMGESGRDAQAASERLQFKGTPEQTNTLNEVLEWYNIAIINCLEPEALKIIIEKAVELSGGEMSEGQQLALKYYSGIWSQEESMRQNPTPQVYVASQAS